MPLLYNKVTSFLKKIIFSFFRFYWNIYLAKKIKRSKPQKPRLFWGTYQIITNKYFSEALKEIGFESKSVVRGIWAINKREDFDLILKDIYPGYNKRFLHLFYYFKLIKYIAENFDIIHTAYCGLISSDFYYFKKEYELLKRAGCKIIVIPYGGDYQQYSSLSNLSLRHALALSYPQNYKAEQEIKKRVDFLQSEADILIPIFQTTAIGEWHVLTFCNYVIDTKKWKKDITQQPKENKNTITIAHAPNHRGCKGTEYIIKAIEELKKEGLQIEFLILEGLSNDEIRDCFSNRVDILVDQLLMCYGINAIEGLSAGLPVLSGMPQSEIQLLLNRYSYFQECPVVFTDHERIKNDLRILINSTELRNTLGKAGREYAEKYHSYRTAQYMFEKIYDKIWYGKEVDLINMYHPLEPNSYNNQSSTIKHPLINNKIGDNITL